MRKRLARDNDVFLLQMTEKFRYRAFLTYAHEDGEHAQKLRRALENFRVPSALVGKETEFGPVPGRLFPIFRDRDELAGSAELGEAIQKALKDSSHLIVLCSPAAAKSFWVNEEIRVFKSMGRANRILCLVLDGKPFASLRDGQPELECLPVAARRKVSEQGKITEEPSEPAAADLRRDQDGEHGAYLKIIAGMLGVGLDDLKQRDLHSRHRRTARIAATASVVALTGFALATYALVQGNLAQEALVETEKERQKTEDELSKTEAVTAFVRELFLSIEPENSQGMDTRLVKTMLDNGTTRAGELKGEPEIEAQVRLTLGATYRSIGAFDEAKINLSRALSLLKSLPNPDESTTLSAMNELAVVEDALGNHIQAEPLFSKLLKQRKKLLGKNHPQVISASIDLANLYRRIGRYEEAEELCSTALAQLKSFQRKEGDPELLRCMSYLATIYLAREKLPQAESLARNTLEISRIHLGEEHPDTLRRAARLANALQALKRFDEAENLSVETVSSMQNILGEEHPETLGAMDALAEIVASRGNNEQALSHYNRILTAKEKALGPMHPETFDTIKAIAHLQKEAGNLSDAETTFIKIYGRMEEKLGDEHPETLRAQNDLAEIYLKSDKAEEAFGLSERLLETELRVLGKEDPLTLRTEARLSELHFLAGRLEEALEGFTTVIATQERILGFDHPEVARSRDFLNQILAERSAATEFADSNLTETKPFQGPLLPESVLPPKTPPTTLLPTELETNIAEEVKKPGAVDRLIGNIRSVIGSNGTKETSRENEK